MAEPPTTPPSSLSSEISLFTHRLSNIYRNACHLSDSLHITRTHLAQELTLLTDLGSFTTINQQDLQNLYAKQKELNSAADRVQRAYNLIECYLKEGLQLNSTWVTAIKHCLHCSLVSDAYNNARAREDEPETRPPEEARVERLWWRTLRQAVERMRSAEGILREVERWLDEEGGWEEEGRGGDGVDYEEWIERLNGHLNI